ncbi:pathogenicity locus [Patescibacteria group bacterium]|nr:pathogenicity locus [Patescibacteria group bacterium]
MKNPLTIIPGVGKSIAQDLNGIGIFRVEELKGKDPDVLYRKLFDAQGMVIDRCLLYVMRCAVYFASHQTHDPELLKWWKWKDTGNSIDRRNKI